MPELGPMMRALELQRLIENKVSEWRERSARVSGANVADSYQQPLNFKRHTNRRKNSAEINRIIAKYSKHSKRADEQRFVVQSTKEEAPVRPARHKKGNSNIKFSKSEDNLLNIGVMDISPEPTGKKETPPRFNLSKYTARSCEDITAFVDFGNTMKSKHFEESSILNSKPVPKERRKLDSIGEDISSMSELSDSGIEIRNKYDFVTSTPISSRKTCPVSDSIDFEKCAKYLSGSELKKGSSEPDILSNKSMDSSRTLDFRKGFKLLKQPFRKSTFDCIIRWRGKKPSAEKTRMAKRAKGPRDVKWLPLTITTAAPPRLLPKWYLKSRSPNRVMEMESLML